MVFKYVLHQRGQAIKPKTRYNDVKVRTERQINNGIKQG